MVVDRIADTCAALAVMLPNPDAAAMLSVVKPIRVQYLLDRFQSHRARILRRHFVARCFDHEAKLVPDLRIEVPARVRMQLEIREQNSYLRHTRRVLPS